MAPTLAARQSASVLRTGFAVLRQLVELNLPDSLERRESLSALHESMELAMRGALDQTSKTPSQE